jgi:hypothetical protein
VDFHFSWAFRISTKEHWISQKVHHVYAKREARLQAAHEAAIFGAPVVVEDKDKKRRSTRRERARSNSRGVDDDGYKDVKDNAVAKVSGVVSEQV